MQLVVGRIAKPHGIRGEVVVEVRTDDPGARFAVGSTLAVDPTGDVSAKTPDSLTIEAARPHQGRYIVLFSGLSDRNRAEELRGVLLCVDSAMVEAAEDPDEFNDFELVGLAAVGADGVALGEIVRIEHAPASDLLVLRQPSGKLSLVPFVRAIVPEVDLVAGRVVLTPPEGLLDL